MNNILNSTSLEIMKIRKDIEEIVNLFNKIALNPYEELSIPDHIMGGFPFRWDLHQIYFFIEDLLINYPISPICIFIIDNKLNAIDLILVNANLITDKDEKNKKRKFLQFSTDYFENTEEHQDFIKTISENIKNYHSIKKQTQKYVSNTFNIKISRILLIPKNIKETSSNYIPDFNHDALGTLNKIVDLKNLMISKENKGIKSKLNYMLNLSFENKGTFRNIKKRLINWQNIDLSAWSHIITTLYDDSISNIVIVSIKRKKILVAAKIIVDNKRISINPLGIKLLRNAFNKANNCRKIAENIYYKTGIRTNVIDETEILEYLNKCNYVSLNLLDILTYSIELIYSTAWYPDSLLNAFLKLFGFKLGPGIKQFNLAFKTVIKYFKNVLIITYQKSIDKKSNWVTLVQMYSNNKKTIVKLIESKNFEEIINQSFEDDPACFKCIKEEVEKNLDTHFNACFGFNIDVLAESLSAKNIQALLSMKSMAHQLPFIATIAGLFAGMKGMKADDKEQPLIQIYEDELKDEKDIPIDKMKFGTYFDSFLKKGICFLSDEDTSMLEIRSPLYSKDGYLGIDMKKILELMR